MGFVVEFIYDCLVQAIFPERKHRWLRGLLYVAPLLLLGLLAAVLLIAFR